MLFRAMECYDCSCTWSIGGFWIHERVDLMRLSSIMMPIYDVKRRHIYMIACDCDESGDRGEKWFCPNTR